jgi:hypothetical protein
MKLAALGLAHSANYRASFSQAVDMLGIESHIHLRWLPKRRLDRVRDLLA